MKESWYNILSLSFPEIKEQRAVKQKGTTSTRQKSREFREAMPGYSALFPKQRGTGTEDEKQDGGRSRRNVDERSYRIGRKQ